MYASERLNLNLNQCGYIPRPLGRPLFDPWAPDTPPLGAGKFIATVYARDATTIDLCLALFEWVPFRRTNAVFKLHKLLDFLLIEAGAFYVIDPGHLTFASAVLHA